MVKRINHGIFYGIFILMMFAAGNVHAQTASVALSDSSAQLGYSFVSGDVDFGKTEFGVGFLYNDSDAYLIESSLIVSDQVGSKAAGLVGGLGAKVWGVTHDEVDVLALGVGGTLRYTFGPHNRIILGADAFYAPPIVSFFDSEWFYEVAARAGYQVLTQASVYLEYRDFVIKDEDTNKEAHAENTLRVGMEVRF